MCGFCLNLDSNKPTNTLSTTCTFYCKLEIKWQQRNIFSVIVCNYIVAF
jgi:hypothetical protein